MSTFRTLAYAYLFTMLGLLFLPLVSRAQALPSTGFPYVTSGNTHVFTGGTTTSANAATFTFGNPANGAVYAQATQSIPIGGGQIATVQPRANIPPATVAKAARNFASKLILPLTVGVAIYDFAKEIGFTLDNSAGPLTVQKPAQYYCANLSGCTFYALNDTVERGGPWSATYADACTSGGPYYAAKRNYQSAVGRVTGSTSCAMDWVAGFNGPFGTSGTDTGIGFKTTTKPYNVAQEASTLQAFEDAIAAKSGWPTGSKVGQVMSDAVASGEPVVIPAPSSVTGPLTVPGVPTVTTFPDGSKTTVTPEKAISYGPGSITVTDKSTTTQTSPSGVVTPVNNSTAPAPLPAPAQEIKIETCGLPGKPMCAVDGAGAPTGETLDQDQGKRTLDPITDFLANPSSIIPALPNINWAFALPASCAVIPITGALSDYMPSIDVCQFQPMFHEIMSMVWMLGGLFGAISLFMRSSLSD